MAKPYTWWNCEDIMGLFETVMREGAENLRLEFHPDREKSLSLVRRERVTLASHEEGGGDFNESHVCPPDCP